MRTGKGSQEEEEYEEEEFGSENGGPSSNQAMFSNANNNNSSSKDGKSRDKANAVRSKHTVTEQRRRRKINERFQRLRDLIPNTDQKSDTASFLLAVIEYVQYLQEKVQKHEDSYQGWSSEPTKPVPWRNSHWRVQSLVGHAQDIKNGCGPGSTFAHTNINPTLITLAQNAVEADPFRDATSKTIDHRPESNAGMPLPIPGDTMLMHPFQRPVSETQSTECLIRNDILNQQEDLTIEGGTISIYSVYSQGLLNSLAQALQGMGLDLSQANMSVQIDLGKLANREPTCAKEPHDSSHQAATHLRDVSSGGDSDHAQKRLKK